MLWDLDTEKVKLLKVGLGLISVNPESGTVGEICVTHIKNKLKKLNK